MTENLLPLFIITTLETKRHLFHYVTQLLFLDYNSDASLISWSINKYQWPLSVPCARHHTNSEDTVVIRTDVVCPHEAYRQDNLEGLKLMKCTRVP